MNQIDIPDYQYYLGCYAKRMVCLTFLEKSQFFIRKFAIISFKLQLLNFKNRSFSSGQGVVQIEPILAWSIPCIYRV